jgi:hypothetical integral membrane protein (TIGR02206 family)
LLILGFQSWFERFRPFTTFHLVTVLVCVGLVWSAIAFARPRVGTPAERRLRVAWGSSILACQLFALVWRLLPANYTLEDGLPLHLCRIAGVIAGLAMIWQWRWARTITYFWGLGLCLQGFITPLRLKGLPSLEYWLFWTVHLQIVGSAFYDVIVLRYRPAFRDWAVAAGAGVCYVAVVVPFNLFFGTDYGWLGRGTTAARELGYLGDGRYRTRNVIDLLGDWPERAILLALIAQTMLALMYAIWQVPWTRPFTSRRRASLAPQQPEHAEVA